MGLIHVYTGDGKGKTTAAIGLAVRFLGCEGCVVLTQFLKGQKSGEITFFEKNENVQIFRLSKDYGFTFSMDEKTKEVVKNEHKIILEKAIDAVFKTKKNQKCLFILDECAGAISTGLLEEEDLITLMNLAEEKFELVLTGRNFSKQILEKADYVSDIQCVRHPMNQGLVARKGIEF